MSEDTILRALLVLVVCVLVVWAYKWLALGAVSEQAPPVVLDPASPRDQAEARCIDEQQRFGRELNGYRWKGGQE